jgi:putative oxidoreductase
MSFSEYLSPLVGRWILVWFFLVEVGRYGGDWDGTITLMYFSGIPVAPLVLVFALILTILGCLSLLLGFHTRHGAMLLFAVTIISAVSMHNFWTLGNAARQGDFELFARDIAVAGGLLFLVGMGPGPYAFDNRLNQKKR